MKVSKALRRDSKRHNAIHGMRAGNVSLKKETKRRADVLRRKLEEV